MYGHSLGGSCIHFCLGFAALHTYTVSCCYRLISLFFSAILMTVFRPILNHQQVFTASFDRCRTKSVTFCISRPKWQRSVCSSVNFLA